MKSFYTISFYIYLHISCHPMNMGTYRYNTKKGVFLVVFLNPQLSFIFGSQDV